MNSGIYLVDSFETKLGKVCAIMEMLLRKNVKLDFWTYVLAYLKTQGMILHRFNLQSAVIGAK
jgi:hypothetical protein